jgi:tetratricopeptide (TPR) repeat protein
MDTSGLVARLRASESPVLWRMAAGGCRLARRVSRHRSRWTSRLGYALERLDVSREARREAAADRAWATGRTRDPVLRQLGLARDRERHGDRAAAVAAYEQVVKASQGRDPWWRLKLAGLHDTVGQWDEAQRVLQANIADHPQHAASHRMLGEVSLRLATWGGTFDGTLADRTAGTVEFGRSVATDSAQARQALERAAALEPVKTAWRASLVEARLADGDLQGAAALLELALRDARASTGRWVLAVTQRWQFDLESIYHRMGTPRVDDPLFVCSAEPGEAVPGSQPVAGLFRARFTFAGLVVTGIVAGGNGSSGDGSSDSDRVEVLLDGVPLRTVNAGGDGFFPEFKLEIRRATLESFPKEAMLEVCTPDGTRLRAPGGADHLRLCIPHGTGDIRDVLAAGVRLDKKGAISPSPDQTRLRQERYLQIYDQVRDFFAHELGRPLFLMYGTLLGYHRDGDFIPGDDDFDAGYVSDATDPVAVKQETMRIIVELVRAGFTVSVNRRGRLFRVQLEREANDGYHLDLRPVWFSGGRVWVHNHCSFPSRRAEFLPVAEGELRGVRVLVPHDTEAFLRGHYGPGWKVPDPGFQYYTSGIDPEILANLARALITVRECRELSERIAREVGDSPPAGRFVSVGSQDLYPLDEFLP